jgi:pimeloyl-ACP methyl ester carboxylesterase
VPLLLLHGRIDGAMSVRLVDISAEALPADSRYQVIDGAGHFMQLDRPEMIAELIVNHVSK